MTLERAAAEAVARIGGIMSSIHTGSFSDVMFQLEVDTGSGGYGYTDRMDELLEDVADEYGVETRNEVEAWALKSKEGDQFHKLGMCITNIG